MPYIKKDRRIIYSQPQQLMAKDAGELNFLITKLIHGYLDKNGICYQRFNDIIGALEGAKLEIYRRRIALYEDVKIKENGDV